MNSIYIIILLLFSYFVYLVVKYSGTEKPKYELQYFRDAEYIKYPPIIAGYLDKRKVKEEHFIATALDFVTKGYIKIEKTKDNMDCVFTIIKKIEASDIEMETLEIFFNNYPKIGVKQSLKQFKIIMQNEKIFGNYGRLKRSFNTRIREYFDKKQDVKKITIGTNIKNVGICYFLFIISSYILVIINNRFQNTNMIATFFVSTIAFSLFVITISFIKFALLGKFSWILPIMVILLFTQTLVILLNVIKIDNLTIVFLILIMMAIIILFDDISQRKKTNLATAYEMIKALKKYIIAYSNIDEYDIYNIYLWEEYYVYAVAMNIKKL